MTPDRARLGAALGACLVNAAAAQAAGAPPPGTFDYVAHARLCVADQCRTRDVPGRVTVLRSGKVLIFFVAPDGRSLQTNGVALELGRTVNLSGRGRLPDTIGGFTPRGGSGTADYDGQRLTLTFDITGDGSLNGGPAAIAYRIAFAFLLEPATGAIRGGTGQVSGSLQGRRADGQPVGVAIAGSSTIEGR